MAACVLNLQASVVAGPPNRGESHSCSGEIGAKIEKLEAIEQKTFDDYAWLALLNRELRNEERFEKWLATAADASPAAAFTSERSPFVYVRCWSIPVPNRREYRAVRAIGGEFCIAVSRHNRMRGVHRINPLMHLEKENSPENIRMHEHKAIHAWSFDADYQGNLYLGNYGIIFCISPDGTYRGQVVCTYRYKDGGGHTMIEALDNGGFYVSDHLGYLG
jgi:hypothetical protein